MPFRRMPPGSEIVRVQIGAELATTIAAKLRERDERPEREVEAARAPQTAAEAYDEALLAGRNDARAIAREITDLCALAGLPELAGEMIVNGMSVEAVRRAIQNRRVEAYEATAIQSSFGMSGQAPDPWQSTVDRLNNNSERTGD